MPSWGGLSRKVALAKKKGNVFKQPSINLTSRYATSVSGVGIRRCCSSKHSGLACMWAQHLRNSCYHGINVCCLSACTCLFVHVFTVNQLSMILKTERQKGKKQTETENANSTSFTSKPEAPHKTNTHQTVPQQQKEMKLNSLCSFASHCFHGWQQHKTLKDIWESINQGEKES